ncbi:MAG: ABC transporter ATP-binding protein [Treponema sp.]|jgi:iron complex transport system ATP-binding protein|nr:ABC transporter ATP-binding protein [Treponema sp.]
MRDKQLACSGLSFSYQKRLTLKDISLSFCKGDFAGLLGPNGSGKSTFLKNLLGFLKPCGGKIVFADPSASNLKTRAKHLAFVSQHSGPPSAMTVRDIVLMGRLPYLEDRWAGYARKDREKVSAALASLGLAELADRNAASLSGGELQKALIARALVQEGDIFLLDEATSGLDLNHAIEIMEIMREKARAEGKTIIAVLHDLNLASAYCSRLVLLKNGRVLFSGKPEEALSAENIEAVYGIRVPVLKDEKGRPFVLPCRLPPFFEKPDAAEVDSHV